MDVMGGGQWVGVPQRVGMCHTTCGNHDISPHPQCHLPQVDDETAPECIWMDDATAWMDDDDLRHKYRGPSISTAPRG